MPLADLLSPAPREVRLAGVLTALPGLAMLVLAVALLAEGLAAGSQAGTNIYAEAAYYVVLAAGCLACAAALVLGKTWARSPSVVIALLLIGVGWYATGPSGRPLLGVPFLAVGILVIVLLFRRPARAWVLGLQPGETEEEAARRGGAAGRAAERERDDG